MSNKRDCKHILGIYENDNNGQQIIIEKDYNCYLLNKDGSNIHVTKFKFCPECGKQLIK